MRIRIIGPGLVGGSTTVLRIGPLTLAPWLGPVPPNSCQVVIGFGALEVLLEWVNIYAAGQSGSHPRPCSLLDDMHAPTNVLHEYKTRQRTWRVRVGIQGLEVSGGIKDRTEADSYRKQLVDRTWRSP